MKHIYFFLFFCIAGVCHAQNQKIHIMGRTIDSFTREELPYVKVTVMRPDSAVVCQVLSNGPGGNMGQFDLDVNGVGHYIFKFTYIGYETAYINKEVKGKRMTYFHFGEASLRLKPRILGEVNVTATKIKMVMKKDTIVFNADAFQLTQGSMLDGLIRQLPGVELKDDGQITVNGRLISSLLVNGEDFFKGDPKIALDNLPAYMVDKVKVYEKEAQDAYITGGRKGEKPLVVDVNLKKQYNIGWIANAEGGYGSKERYMGRLFGLRFTDNSRLALFGNFNNTNDTREPGTSGNWGGGWQPTGLLSIKMGGAELLVNDKFKKFKITSNIKAMHEDTDDQTEASGIRFFQGGDTYTRNQRFSENSQTHVVSNHDFAFTLPKIFIQFNPSVEYFRYKNSAFVRSAEFSADPMDSYRGASIDSIFLPIGSRRLEQILINRLSEQTLRDGDRWKTTGGVNSTIRIPNTLDYLKINAAGEYNKETENSFSHYDLHYGEQLTSRKDEFRNRYFDKPTMNYKWNAGATYDLSLQRERNFHIESYYFYNQYYSSANRSLYRLDQYEEWNSPEGHALGDLPSTTDSLQQTIDRKNSYYSTRNISKQNVGMNMIKNYNFAQNKGFFTITLKLPGAFALEKLDYKRDNIDTLMTRRINKIEPGLSLEMLRIGSECRSHYNFDYNYSVDAPNMSYLLDTRDDSNPLSIWLGNSGLKNKYSHDFSFKYNTNNQQKQRTVNVILDYNLWLNAISQAMHYNRETGVSTYRPENINGNWKISGAYYISQAVDEKRRLQLSSNLLATYNNSVDYVSVAGEESSSRSSVRNFRLIETVSADYRFKQYYVGAKVNANWTYGTSKRIDFSTINSLDFSYGIKGQVPVVWDMELSTDITMYSRRGYKERSMNTDDLTWNARLSKKFMKGNLICIIDGFDILGNLSKISYSLNAQGKTETYYNVIPRYVMMHLIYRLNIQPQKK